METELDDFTAVEKIFGRSIQMTPYIALWSSYINYIRRRNNLTTDQTGSARKIVIQVYEFVLENVGIDPDAGSIWTDYIEVLKSEPGVLGGSTWQDKQKMDTLRVVYQRAIAVPTTATMDIWKDYDRFEMNLNKATVCHYPVERTPNLADHFAGPKTPAGKIGALRHCSKHHQRSPRQLLA